MNFRITPTPEQSGYRERLELINAMHTIIEPPNLYDELPLVDYPHDKVFSDRLDQVRVFFSRQTVYLSIRRRGRHMRRPNIVIQQGYRQRHVGHLRQSALQVL
jgi:hypothetical protein